MDINDYNKDSRLKYIKSNLGKTNMLGRNY